jgi:pilus assembly protein CpaC
MVRSSALLCAALLALAPREALAQRRGATAAATPGTAEAPPVKVTQELTLAVGENRTISAADVRNYSEGTPGIVDVKLTSDQSQFVVVGLKPGSTSLLLIRRGGGEVLWNINVFSKAPEIVESELHQLLDGYTGIRVRRIGPRFFIEGGVNTEGDVARIKQIAALYPGQVESLVALGSGGSDRKTNVRLDFFFVQYSKSSGYNVGVSYPTRIGGEVIQSNFGYDFIAETATASTNVVNQPLPGLDIASRSGWAKVAKQAAVITTNGTEASFENGGEQNFTVANGLTSTIQRIKFGTALTVLPRFDPVTKDLEIKVDADVSDLTPPVRSTPLPGRQTSHLVTIVRMKLGQSLVLSGIHTRSDRRSTQGLPILSEIPILGGLFGTNGKDTEEVEGAIFIIPSVVEAPSRGALELVRSAWDQYDTFAGKTEEVEAFAHTPETLAPSVEAEKKPTP